MKMRETSTAARQEDRHGRESINPGETAFPQKFIDALNAYLAELKEPVQASLWKDFQDRLSREVPKTPEVEHTLNKLNEHS